MFIEIELLRSMLMHRYRDSETGLETPVIDILSVLCYNYSDVAERVHTL